MDEELEINRAEYLTSEQKKWMAYDYGSEDGWDEAVEKYYDKIVKVEVHLIDKIILIGNIFLISLYVSSPYLVIYEMDSDGKETVINKQHILFIREV